MTDSGPPSSEQRKTCYIARDNYYHCSALKGQEAPECVELRKIYEAKCLASWVRYFDRRQLYEAYKKKLKEQGYVPLETTTDEKRKKFWEEHQSKDDGDE